MTMGMVTDDQAASRVFCNYTQGLEYMVWTQNDGRLMGYVAVHHNIGIGPPCACDDQDTETRYCCLTGQPLVI
jgi:hypothetical protein